MSQHVATFPGHHPAANLPLQPTPLLGRANDYAMVRQQLLSDDVRLLTISGTAGVGKTRLAISVAADLHARFHDGVWFVDLSRVREREQVLLAVAQVMGLRLGHGGPTLAQLQDRIAKRRILLILDNFEQVLAASASIAELITSCPELKVLVTSRVRLRLRWEHVLSLEPLPSFEASESRLLDEAATSPAEALFIERAQASYPAFALTRENLLAVGALCRYLQGVPLAIELAAARTNVLDPAAIQALLMQHPQELRWDAIDVPRRQQSMHSALEWSYKLLPEAHQALFRRLGVFLGSATLQTAIVVGQPNTLGLDPLDGLSALVDASLVQVRESVGGERRFSLLHLVREFAVEELAACGELEETSRRYARCFLSMAELYPPRGECAVDARAGHARLLGEQLNLLGALAWTMRCGDRDLEARLERSLGSTRELLGLLLDRGSPPNDDVLRFNDISPGTSALTPALIHLQQRLSVAVQRVPSGCTGAEDWTIDSADLDGASVEPRTAEQRRPRRQHHALVENSQVDSPGEWSEVGCLQVWFALLTLALLARERRDQDATALHIDHALALCTQSDDGAGPAHLLRTLAAALSAPTTRHAVEGGTPVDAASQNAPGIAQTVYAALRAGCLTEAIRDGYTPETGAAPWLKVDFGRNDRLVPIPVPVSGDAGAAATAEAEPVSPSPERLPATTARGMRQSGPLSPREHEVLILVGEGMTNKEIAERLIISVATVNFHVTSLLNKLVAENRTQAVARAMQHGLLTITAAPTECGSARR